MTTVLTDHATVDHATVDDAADLVGASPADANLVASAEQEGALPPVRVAAVPHMAAHPCSRRHRSGLRAGQRSNQCLSHQGITRIYLGSDITDFDEDTLGALDGLREARMVRDPHTETAGDEPCDPAPLCCTVVRATVEVLAGTRPSWHLARWVTPRILDQLCTRAALLAAHREAAGPTPAGRLATAGPTVGVATAADLQARSGLRPVAVRRVRVDRHNNSAEATVIINDHGRVRAAALRLEAHRKTWRVTALELG
ncbi:MAG: Rv3235 family protein [Cellulomonadaceae bacterium]|jgi:hypothetical protein|nr:Rv3235 family protein [Cellulomonadaceae bacterium]